MRKYITECISLFVQLVIFYILPLFAGPTDTMGLILLILVFTGLLSVILGYTSKKLVRFLFPAATAAIFQPSVFLYYNSSAFIHAVWYFTVSMIGVLFGSAIQRLISNLRRN